MNIYISGVTGRVGRILLKKIIEDDNLSISGGSASTGNGNIGLDLGTLNESKSLGIVVSATIQPDLVTDCIIDFSEPKNSLNAIKFASEQSIPILIGTTGFKEDEFEKINILSSSMPLLLAPNTSLGIALLKNIIEDIGEGFKHFSTPSIVERHHKDKKDSPSGTALDLANKLSSLGLYEEDIAIQSERLGDSAGNHRIIFKRNNESIELIHNASDRSLFADGALEAIKWLITKEPGLYSMSDIYSSSNR
jgi:4-hydroxy-tetrahydrodipicolinate reductase